MNATKAPKRLITFGIMPGRFDAGATIVEFCLVALILLMILLGVFDIAAALRTRSLLAYATEETAHRIAAQHGLRCGQVDTIARDLGKAIVQQRSGCATSGCGHASFTAERQDREVVVTGTSTFKCLICYAFISYPNVTVKGRALLEPGKCE